MSWQISVDGEAIYWSGYNDPNWWSKVANNDTFQLKRSKSGRLLRLNPHNDFVSEEKE